MQHGSAGMNTAPAHYNNPFYTVMGHPVGGKWVIHVVQNSDLVFPRLFAIGRENCLITEYPYDSSERTGLYGKTA
jgi:hypothetical protein